MIFLEKKALSVSMRSIGRHFYMTQHPSFTRSGGGAANRRNVLKRHERVDLLKKRGMWTESSSVLGMPKTKPEE